MLASYPALGLLAVLYRNSLVIFYCICFLQHITNKMQIRPRNDGPALQTIG